MRKNIYVVLSQTGSIPAALIRKFTRGKYSHCSLCLREDVKEMYSFGRWLLYFPLVGGFVKESPDFGVFKRFHDSEVRVLRLQTDEETYNKLQAFLEDIYQNRKKYKYNYIGVFLAIFNRPFKRKNIYYCSEFISETLINFGVLPADWTDKKVVKPMDFLNLPSAEFVYEGKISDFAGKGRTLCAVLDEVAAAKTEEISAKNS